MTDTPSGSAHVPVLLEQVVEALAPVDKGVYIDGTYGGGGYSRAVLAVADCKIIAIDRDPDAQARAWEHAGKDARLRPAPGRFSELHLAARANGHEHVDGVMLDLGVSSFQIDQAERGFSFMRDGPLDMRMEKSGPSAADAVNLLEEKQLSAIFHFLGNWTAFIWPLIVTNDPDIYTIPVGIASFNGEFQMDWEVVMTASCLATLPTLLVFLLLQKFIIRGIMLAGLKG